MQLRELADRKEQRELKFKQIELDWSKLDVERPKAEMKIEGKKR